MFGTIETEFGKSEEIEVLRLDVLHAKSLFDDDHEPIQLSTLLTKEKSHPSYGVASETPSSESDYFARFFLAGAASAFGELYWNDVA